MRFYEFDLNEDQLYEIKMKPGYLAKLASNIDAQAGMEFEMIVPFQDEDPQPEPDYDYDEYTKSFSNIREFFLHEYANDENVVNGVIDQLNDEWREWAQERIDHYWKQNGFEYYQDFFRRELWDIKEYEKEIKQRALELSNEDESDIIPNESMMKKLIDDSWDRYLLTKKAAGSDTIVLIKLAEKEIFEKVSESFWKRGVDVDQAKEQFEEDEYTEYTPERFLRFHYENMSNIEEHFSLTWPYITWPEKEMDLETISQDFGVGIGKPVNFSHRYHGAHRAPGHYVVEPDSSLEPDEPSSETGLEFISHAMPIQELLNDLENIFIWTDKIGAYTNESCGLHMNVSISNQDFNNLDYVKLALLLGDEYILKQFDRSTSRFAASAFKQIKATIEDYEKTFNDQEIINVLNKMKSKFDQSAARTVHGLYTDKYSSINIKHGGGNWWIEFRSPGGDWLNKSIEELTATLLRFVVALDAALDPTKYRNEYAKKLYKLLDIIGDPDSLEIFVKYATGEWSIQQIKSALRLRHKINIPQISVQNIEPNQIQPSTENNITTLSQISSAGRYLITNIPSGARIIVTATDQEDAEQQARSSHPYTFAGRNAVEFLR